MGNPFAMDLPIDGEYLVDIGVDAAPHFFSSEWLASLAPDLEAAFRAGQQLSIEEALNSAVDEPVIDA